jgi:hypothetical protein
MGKVKIIAVSDPELEGKNEGAGSPPFCTDPAYIGQTAETMGGVMTLAIPPRISSVYVRCEDGSSWLFKPEHLQEVAE